MLFGRVEGVVVPVREGEETRLKLTVYLETGRRLELVREAILTPLTPLRTRADLTWHADQWTQETIGVELAEAGWEVIAAGDPPEPQPGELARSATYAVRRLG